MGQLASETHVDEGAALAKPSRRSWRGGFGGCTQSRKCTTSAGRGRRQIPNLHVFQHALAKRGHGGLLGKRPGAFQAFGREHMRGRESDQRRGSEGESRRPRHAPLVDLSATAKRFSPTALLGRPAPATGLLSIRPDWHVREVVRRSRITSGGVPNRTTGLASRGAARDLKLS